MRPLKPIRRNLASKAKPTATAKGTKQTPQLVVQGANALPINDPDAPVPTLQVKTLNFTPPQEVDPGRICGLFRLRMCYSSDPDLVERRNTLAEFQRALIVKHIRDKPPCHERVKAILTACIKLTFESFRDDDDDEKSSCSSSEPPKNLVLRTDVKVERYTLSQGDAWHLVANAHHVVAYSDESGTLRDYLVVGVAEKDGTGRAGVMNSSVLAYMAIVHTSLKDRQEDNSVVRRYPKIGLSRDIEG
ncbi:hypothetical protein BO70DRAFT_400932 [Aspergillus heteromorphus CBS 117.55]|uniref:Uncharacterized protein n=1 Tax=Aspergillus heteromorphus CBS 117.55 TaxID=1448321 RepID=A0A317UVA2_9EURO|nr:uncharacterized protein BO70DRAFT_400932 [Aspergillus heteromorphus CBS 117.55]PWY65983.1 hypothetical protein BO70DRAFT_400932 [Aspergillus heteromorphus CBS 117.55]